MSSFYKSFLTLLTEIIEKNNKSVTHTICLGLGQISTCKIAQHQLGLLLLLREHFLCPIEVFDPVFSSTDKDIITHFKLELGTTNCEGKRKPVSSAGFTFFFFPSARTLTSEPQQKKKKAKNNCNAIRYDI